MIYNNINWNLYWDGQKDTERCGLIFGYIEDDGGITIEACVELKNSHPDPKDHYAITEADFKRALKVPSVQGLDLLGSVHTHLAKHGGISYNDVVGLRKHMLALGVMLHLPTRTIYYYNGSGYISRERIAA